MRMSQSVSTEGVEVKWSMDNTIFMEKLDPFLVVWHKVLVVGNMWRDCGWCEEVIA
jgi:hypothetical protein